MHRLFQCLLGSFVIVCASCEADVDGFEDEEPTCGDADRYEPYVPGLEREGEAGAVVSLERAIPGPPEKGDNEWTLHVIDADGASMDDLELLVSPFMPDHGHGSPVDPIVTPGDEAGEYLVDLVFNMGGFWEVSISLDEAGGEQLDEVQFGICIED